MKIIINPPGGRIQCLVTAKLSFCCKVQINFYLLENNYVWTISKVVDVDDVIKPAYSRNLMLITEISYRFQIFDLKILENICDLKIFV